MLYVWVGSAVFTAVAGYTDLKTGKIRNWLVVTMLAAGLGYHFCNHTFLFAAQGFGFGMATIILYFCGIFGEGDVKLMAALGSLVGPVGVVFVLLVACVGVLVYWLWAMLLKGNARENIKHEWLIFRLYGASLFYVVTGLRFDKIKETMEEIKVAQVDSPTVPYGVFISLGVLAGLAATVLR